MSDMTADTQKISQVSGELSRLADRLQGMLAKHRDALTPQAAGSDEVSVRAAATMNEVHKSFDEAGAKGVTELREIAAAVATVSTTLREADTNKDFVTKSDKATSA